MPLSRTVQTGSLLTATALTAISLNLGVLTLGDGGSTETGSVDAATSGESVELVAAQPTVPPIVAPTPPPDQADPGVLAVGNAQAGDPANPVPAPSSQASAAPRTDTSGTEPDHDDDHDEDFGHDEDYGHDDDQPDRDEGPRPETKPAPETTSTLVRPTPTTASPTSDTTRSTPRKTTTSQPVSSQPPVDDTPEPPTTPAPVTEYLTYEFRGVATIIVALHDGRRLEFWSATPESGWVFKVDDDLPSKVKLQFRPLNGGDEAEWELKMDDGELELKQEY